MMFLGCKMLCLCGHTFKNEELDKHYDDCEAIVTKKKEHKAAAEEAAQIMLTFKPTEKTNDEQ